LFVREVGVARIDEVTLDIALAGDITGNLT
jgi:hypothetical protein